MPTSVDQPSNVARESGDNCDSVPYPKLVQSLPASNLRSLDNLDRKQRMIVSASDALSGFCDNLHRWLIMVNMESSRDVFFRSPTAR